MILAWSEEAWQDYLWWQTKDHSTLKRINRIIADILRHPFEGRGKPERLKLYLQWILVPAYFPGTPASLCCGR